MTDKPRFSSGQDLVAGILEMAQATDSVGPVAPDDLIARILEVTKSPQSVPYYKKAIAGLGIGVVEEELAELRYRMQTSSIDEPAKYLTTLLQKRFAVAAAGGGTTTAAAAPSAEQTTYQNATALGLFSELRPLAQKGDQVLEEATMDRPYSSKTVPWATFIGPDFFTLSTNKAKSDRVLAKFRMLDGKVIEIPLIRGRFFPKDEDRGILTSEEGRILGAMESFWIEQGCHYARFGNGSVSCFCQVSLRGLARLIGREAFGGSDQAHLNRKIINLSTKGYYLELDAVPELREAGLKGYGFSLIAGIDQTDRRTRGTERTTIRVRFSDPFSRQLLARRVVSRSKDILRMRSELAFLVRLYLEPILMSRGVGREHSIELSNLIKILNLPAAGWHSIKSRRRQIFNKALAELNEMKTSDGNSVQVEITQGQNAKDFKLVARLVADPAAPLKVLPEPDERVLRHG